MPAAKLKLSHNVSTIDLVRQFHETFKHPVAKALTPGDAKLRRLRVALLAEELAEFAQAAGVSIRVEVSPFIVTKKLESTGYGREVHITPEALCLATENVDLVEMADALGDIDYVCQGANLVFGIPSGLVLANIHESNMGKLGADGEPIFDPMGKIVKGPNYTPPNIKAIFETFDPKRELL